MSDFPELHNYAMAIKTVGFLSAVVGASIDYGWLLVGGLLLVLSSWYMLDFAWWRVHHEHGEEPDADAD